MMLITVIIAALLLLIGSFTDMKKREVHDYVSYGLIVIGFASAVLHSITSLSINPLMNSLMGFVLGLAIAYAMFYLGQWGGGDSKLMMGLGATIGFNVFAIFGNSNYWLLVMLICVLFIGAVYGMIWSIYLAIKNKKAFIKKAKALGSQRNILLYRRILMIFVLLSCIVILTLLPRSLRIPLMLLVAFLYVIFYLWIFVKIVEDSCMLKDIAVGKLTEGDWIYKNVYIGKKYVAGPKDLGISREQIAILKKSKIKTVLVKEGIPFIPVFLLSYLAVIAAHYLSLLPFL